MRVTSLYVYPLKSARAIAVEEAVLDDLGFTGDRRWCVVDAEGRVVTQRECPILATVSVGRSGDGIVLRQEGRDPMSAEPPNGDEDPIPVRVRRDRTLGLPSAPDVDRWLEEALGRPVRLVYMPDTVRRPVNPAYGRPGDRVSFADGYPILLASKASLQEVNRRLAVPVPMDRFRPNVVIDGAEAFEEDGWSRVRIGSIEFRVVKPCSRCVVITTDQRTGEREPEPMRTLTTFRSWGGKVWFGQNLVHDGLGAIRCGDPIEVLSRRV